MAYNLNVGRSTNYIPDEVLKAELELSEFKEPLETETRVLRRNLLLTTCIALTVISLKLQITGISWFQAQQPVTPITSTLISGILLTVSTYFFVAFLLHFYSNIKAWRSEKEILNIEPYVFFLSQFNLTFQVFLSRLEEVKARLDQTENQERQQSHVQQLASTLKTSEAEVAAQHLYLCNQLNQSTQQLLTHIQSQGSQIFAIHDEVHKKLEEYQPILDLALKTVKGLRRLNTRLVIVKANLWLIDLALPVGLYLILLSKTYQSIPPLINRLYNANLQHIINICLT